MKSNMVGWFEIPVEDMDRAKKFYDAIFEINIQVQDFGGVLMGWFPWAEGKPGAAGSLIHEKNFYRPSNKDGILIYFSSEDVQNELDRVEASGGKILKPKTQISPEVGYSGLFLDTEGNRIALHSRK
ncbi:VOC family protein [Flagellimonas allohymeniacidonis]|uniref:VOC family protein n=1 Tax=Flagellimonas allohymeniacidonis TaxID=2517819 RepID=A0A4Q8QIP4_9FLAO|nr:VOC family protein [Allomuricauda hymeniacidonis]TAI49128.1 VOC family protein [Allomuricauda hymeniacidonis]